MRQIKSFARVSILSLAKQRHDFFSQSCPKVYVTRCNPPHAPQYYHLPRPLTLLFSSSPVSLSLSLCLLSPCQSSVQHHHFEEICSTLIFPRKRRLNLKLTPNKLQETVIKGGKTEHNHGQSGHAARTLPGWDPVDGEGDPRGHRGLVEGTQGGTRLATTPNATVSPCRGPI